MKLIYTFRFLIIVVFLAIAFPVQAQWSIGLEAGYTHNSLTTSSGYLYGRIYDPQGGLTIGVPILLWSYRYAEGLYGRKGATL